MGEIVSSNLVPGAGTCVLVGAVQSWPMELAGYGLVLWLKGDRQAVPGIPKNTQVVVPPCLGAEAAQLKPVLEQFLQASPRRMPSVFLSSATLADPTTYTPVMDELSATLEAHHRARLTRQEDGFLWQSHVLSNLPAYVSARLPQAWAGAAKGIPAFVCGAGPSLDVSGPALARQAGKGLVLAADSALRKLQGLGVSADIVVSVDVAKTPDKCLPEGAAPALAVLSMVSPPEWPTRMPQGACAFVSSNQITVDWLERQGCPRTAVSGLENCGATALELARHLGCEPIYLFGMDLALSGQGTVQRHHSGVDKDLYAKSGFEAASRFPEVPGNHEARVRTHVIGDWRTLDARLATWPQGLVHNVNDRGARLANTTVHQPAALEVPEHSFDRAALLSRLACPPVTAPLPAELHAKLQALLGNIDLSLNALSALEAKGGVDALIAEWRGLLQNPDTAQFLGAFSFKLIPHLIPPVEATLAQCAEWRKELHAPLSQSSHAPFRITFLKPAALGEAGPTSVPSFHTQSPFAPYP